MVIDSLLYRILDTGFEIIYFILLIRVLMSWIPHNPYHPIAEWLHRLTDPLLRPFQNLVPSHRIGIDLSPIFAFLAIALAKQIIFRILFY